MFYVTSEIYLNNDLGSLAVSVDNYPQKRKNHLTITYKIYYEIYNNGGGNLYDGVYGDDIESINEFLSKQGPKRHESFSWKQAIDEPEYLESKMNEIIELLMDKDLHFVDHGFWVNYDKRELSLVDTKGENWVYITYGTEANANDEMRRMKSHGFIDVTT